MFVKYTEHCVVHVKPPVKLGRRRMVRRAVRIIAYILQRIGFSVNYLF